MESSQMTLERLQELLQVHGGDPERWPEAERQQALALCERDPEAAVLYRSARVLDGLLSEALSPEPSAQLVRRVAEIPIRHPRAAPERMWWPFGGVVRTMLAAAFTLGLGVVTGLSTTPPQLAQVQQEEDDEESWESFEQLAFGPELGDDEVEP